VTDDGAESGSDCRPTRHGLLREAARFTPGQAVHALADVTQASNLPSVPLAAALLIAYLVPGAVLAAVTLERRDLI